MGALEDAPSSAHHDPPILGVLSDECLHQLLALSILEVDHVDAAGPESVFATGKCCVLAPAIIGCQLEIRRDPGISRAPRVGPIHDDSRDLVQNACSSAHITRAEGRVNRRPFVDTRWLSAKGLKGGHLGLAVSSLHEH